MVKCALRVNRVLFTYQIVEATLFIILTVLEANRFRLTDCTVCTVKVHDQAENQTKIFQGPLQAVLMMKA